MGALDKIRVIDFGHYVAGPVTGMLLADQGADVIKVDPPSGPALDVPANRTWNRGKRSIALDLTTARDVAVAQDLVAGADVVVENFRPGVMDRLGLGPAEMRSGNTSLVYASMPGFGPDDPRADLPAWEGVVLAAVDAFRPAVEYQGLLKQLHRRPGDREGDPVFTAEPVASMFAALLASIGITAALHVRDLTGMGQQVEVPLFDAAIQAMGLFGLAQLPFRAAGHPLASPWDHQYRCADGRWVHLACTEPHHAGQLAELIGRPDLVEQGLTGRHMPSPADHYRLHRLLSQLLATEPAQHWEDLLVAEELPGIMARSSAEWLTHPQARLGSLFVGIDDPVLGPTRQPAPVVRLSESPSKVDSAAPRPDEHRQGILTEATRPPHSRRSITTLIAPNTGPLHGLRVIDLSIVLSGPTCGRTLAELGADVVKIDDPTRGEVLYHHDVNRGKRSILLDLDTEAGKGVFWELAASADVVIENFRSGVVEDLGIDYETVRRIKPDVIYVSLNAYGDEGPWADLPGYEGTVEALTGMQVRYGGADSPALWPFAAVTDYASGFATAYGVLLALLERNITGKGQRVNGSMARTSGLLQSMFLLDHQGQDWSEPSGRDARGFGPGQALYRCADGWIFVGIDEIDRLAPLLDGTDDAADATASDPAALEERLRAWCADHPMDAAVAALCRHGAGAQPLAWFNDVMTDPVVARRGLSVIRSHDDVGMLRTTGPGPWLSHSKVDAGHPASRPGAGAASVLADIGRAGDLQVLVEAGVIGLPSDHRQR